MNPPDRRRPAGRAAQQEASDRPARDRRAPAAPRDQLGVRPPFSSEAARQRVAIPYSPTFLAQVQAGNVSTVTAQDAAIQGTLKHAIRYPARDKNATTATEFSTRVPDFADTKALDTLLQEKGVVVTAKAPPGTPWWETLLAGFGPTLLFFGLWYWIMRRVGQRQHVLLRQLEGEEVRADGRAGHVRGRRRHRRGQGGAGRGRRLPARPGQVPQARRPHPARRPADRRARHRQDAARAGGRRRGGRAVLLDVGVGVRRDDRRRRRLPRPRPVRAGEGGRSVDHLHRRDRRDRPLAQLGCIQRRERRARADAQPDPDRDGRLRRLHGRDRPRGHEPPRRARLGAAAAGPLRPPGAGSGAGQGRPRADPARPHARRSRSRPDVDLDALAATTAGMVGADLANLANEAALLAARRDARAGDDGRLHRRAREDRARDRRASCCSPRRTSGAPPTTRPATRSSGCSRPAPTRSGRSRSSRAR